MYGLKMWLRNVRHPSRTRRFWYHIRVLFIVLARICRCVVTGHNIRESKMASKTGNNKTFCVYVYSLVSFSVLSFYL